MILSHIWHQNRRFTTTLEQNTYSCSLSVSHTDLRPVTERLQYFKGRECKKIKEPTRASKARTLPNSLLSRVVDFFFFSTQTSPSEDFKENTDGKNISNHSLVKLISQTYCEWLSGWAPGAAVKWIIIYSIFWSFLAERHISRKLPDA